MTDFRRSAGALPTGYRLEYDPDVLVLRRGDGSEAAAFSARVPTPRRWSRSHGRTSPTGSWDENRC